MMALPEVLPLAQSMVKNVVNPGDLVVDATMGNGHDTLFLANLVGPTGLVLAYDIQEEALNTTRQRLLEARCEAQVRLLLKGHQSVVEELEPLKQPVSAAMFNLGYRPGGDKKVVTRPDTTLAAIEGLAHYLKPGGVITLVVYSGHPGGEEEAVTLVQTLSGWSHKQYNIARYGWLNRPNHPPYLVVIEKRV